MTRDHSLCYSISILLSFSIRYCWSKSSEQTHSLCWDTENSWHLFSSHGVGSWEAQAPGTSAQSLRVSSLGSNISGEQGSPGHRYLWFVPGPSARCLWGSLCRGAQMAPAAGALCVCCLFGLRELHFLMHPCFLFLCFHTLLFRSLLTCIY